ncbi:MAG TPA: hypothetical protein HA255_01785 [Methanosphaera sp.]|nr:hypothetical protein [Methanosphaera sp.]
MIKFECDSNYNMYRYKLIGGKVTSIWNGDKVMLGGSSYPVIDFKYYTSDFCNFEKNISEANSKMVYHLSGYGALHNEAFSSYLGESSERYTFASLYKVIENIIEIGTYDEMYSKYGENKIPPLNLLNGYFLPTERDHYLSSECKIRWVPMNSLINPEEKVYVPLQMVISNDGLICKDEVQFMPSAVSTGTASQETFLKSLENAVIEYLQIDSFNLWWYGGCKGKKIEINTIDFLRTFFDDYSGRSANALKRVQRTGIAV